MFWYILLGISILVGGICFILYIKNDSDLFFIVVLAFVVIVCVAPVAVSKSIEYKNEIATFERTKQYIEEVVPNLPTTDNYSITTKKIEMNEWLYKIQYRYKNYHFWNFVPKKVMELKEIK